MTRIKQQPLPSSGSSPWIKGMFNPRAHMSFYIDNYLFGCPAAHTSALSKAYAPLVNVNNGESATALQSIRNGISSSKWFCAADKNSVARRLIELRLDGPSVPRGGAEFAIFTRSPKGILKDYGLYEGIKAEDLRAEHVNPFAKLLELDSFFRHIRNAIAHGLLTEVKRKSLTTGRMESYIYLQDNSGSDISARLFLSHSRLELISQSFTERDR